MIDLEMKSELLEGGTCVVSVAGELDMSTAPRFKQSLLGALGGLDTLFAIHPSRAAAFGGTHF
jgi:anti-anti-sigma regulatory factor